MLVLRGLLYGGWQLGYLVFGRDHWEHLLTSSPELRAVVGAYITDGMVEIDDSDDVLTEYYEDLVDNGSKHFTTDS